MKISKLLLILVAFMAFSGTLFSQSTGKIAGKITDASTGNGLPGANVFIEGTNMGAATDLKGSYIILSVPAGTYNLIFKYIGYEEKTVEVTVVAGKYVTKDARLEYKVLEGEDVVVTAQAEGQIQAINQQISSNTIKNIVSSAKIQELPEANAAEAVGRLPGISLKREGGEGNKVVIRGLSPQYNKIQIDGVSMAATDTSDRSVDLSMISPNMLEGIEVSKTAMADQEGDKLGGSVNFILRGAPEGIKFNFIAKQGYNNLREEMKNYHYIVGGSKRFYDNRFGVLVQGNMERKDRSDNNIYAGYEMLHDSLTIANSVGFQDISRINKRRGAVVVLDYKTQLTTVKFSNIYSDIDVNTYSRQEHLAASGRTHSYNGTYSEENMAVLMNSLQLEQYLGNVKMTGSVNFTRSESEVPEELRIEANENNAFVRSWTYDDAPMDPALFRSKTVNDTSKIFVNWFRHETRDVMEKDFSTDLNFEWNYSTGFADFKFKIGGKYKHKNKEYEKEEKRIPLGWNDLDLVRRYLADEFGLTNYDNAQDFPYRPFIDYDYNPGNFMAGNYTISRIPDVDRMRKYYHAIENLKTVNGQTVRKTVYRDYNASIQNDYDGSEDYWAAYLMPTINIGKMLTFIPGLRYEHNKTEYTGYRADSPGKWSDPFPYDTSTASRKNDYFLPMLHVKYQPLDWFDVRASYTHTISRPGYQWLIPKWATWEDNLTWNNTSLKPSTSKNIDVFLSFYSSKLGLFTVGGFQKKIKDFIFNTTTWLVDSTYLDPRYPASVKPGGKVYGYINNPNEADLYGMELEWQSNFWFLPGALKGIVLTTNYTYTYSKLRYPRQEAVWELVKVGFIKVPKIVGMRDGSYEARLIDQPTHTFNLTIGYDYKGFGIRSSVQYKSDVFAANNWYKELRQNTEPLTLYDMKIKQKLPVKGLELFFNLNNFSKAIEQSSNNGTGWFTYRSYYGLSADVGIKYEFN